MLHFPVAVSIMLYKISLHMKESATIPLKPTEQSFPMALLSRLYKVVLTFDSVDEILKCDLSNENS